ncbi:MarR family transcriptional regulator [Falsarthrobacter nasiphocae]|uniref:DNA-binding MarR family transcriptional regulator n=1 Tax=Falsarthrobacter nasiphocae TaxID=189863 RepID=A0AAE3YCX1_9MICC|nr:MarR family transcriptional regulator [Falsarthrobacter nasiphocae]MDR6891573.1 DNA-binding MarR family transcriptional regulator [Falsarthrobacter nasiphocae]
MEFKDSTFYKLGRATQLITHVADTYLESHHGLRYSSFLVLLILRTKGPSPQHVIADALGVSRPSITQRIAPLVERGLVSVERNPESPRSVVASLTDEGLGLINEAWPGLERAFFTVDADVDHEFLTEQLDLLISNATQALEELPAPPAVRLAGRRGDSSRTA